MARQFIALCQKYARHISSWCKRLHALSAKQQHHFRTRNTNRARCHLIMEHQQKKNGKTSGIRVGRCEELLFIGSPALLVRSLVFVSSPLPHVGLEHHTRLAVLVGDPITAYSALSIGPHGRIFYVPRRVATIRPSWWVAFDRIWHGFCNMYILKYVLFPCPPQQSCVSC